MKLRKNYDVTVVANERLQPTHEEIHEALCVVVNKKIRALEAEKVLRSGEFWIDTTSRIDIV